MGYIVTGLSEGIRQGRGATQPTPSAHPAVGWHGNTRLKSGAGTIIAVVFCRVGNRDS